MVHLLWRTVYHILIKCSLQDRIHPRKAKMYFHKRYLQKYNNSKCKSYQPKIWKWPKCPSTNECFNGILFTQCCTAQNTRNEVATFTGAGLQSHHQGLRKGCVSTVSTAREGSHPPVHQGEEHITPLLWNSKWANIFTLSGKRVQY